MSRPPPNPVFTFKGSMKPVHSLMYDLNEDEELIYGGTQNGTIHVWDLKNNKEAITYTVGKETCLAIHKVQTTDGALLITQEKNGIYRFWSLSDNKLLLRKEFDTKYFGFCRSVITEDNRYLVCPLNNAVIKLITINSSVDSVKVIENDKSKSDGEIMIVKLIKTFLFVVYESGVIKVWSLDSEGCLFSKNLISDCPMGFDVSDPKTSDNIIGYVGSNSDVVKELNIEICGTVSITTKREMHLTNPGVSNIRIRRDNKLFVISCWDKRLRLFSCKSLKLLVVLDFHKDVVQDIVFSNSCVSYWNCQYLLAAGSSDGRISLWDLY